MLPPALDVEKKKKLHAFCNGGFKEGLSLASIALCRSVAEGGGGEGGGEGTKHRPSAYGHAFRDLNNTRAIDFCSFCCKKGEKMSLVLQQYL